MKRKIIQSVIIERRDSISIFLLSFLFTGLGQVYSGELPRGVIFLFFRLISLLIIPMYIILYYSMSFLHIFSVLIIFHILIWIAAPLEYYVPIILKKRELKIKRYNRKPFYILFGFFNMITVSISIVTIALFFDIERVDSDSMYPTLLEGEYLLINRYMAGDLKTGDAILYRDDNNLSTGRLLARQGDTFSYSRGLFKLNRQEPQFGVFNNLELEALGFENVEHVFFEINKNRRYPILYDMKEKNTRTATEAPVKINENELLIAFDNRKPEKPYAVIKSNSVIGRIEGVIFSLYSNRMMLLPYVEMK